MQKDDFKHTLDQSEDDLFGIIIESFEDDSPVSLSFENILYMKDNHDRRLYLEVEISQASISTIIQQIRQFNREDQGKPIEERKRIKLFISSPGGSVMAGVTLKDVIKNSITPVDAIIGYACSMAVYIAIAADRRFVSDSSFFMIHKGYISMDDTTTVAENAVDFNRVVNKDLNGFLVGRTKLTQKELNKNKNIDWYIYGKEDLLKYGLATDIISQDTDYTEIY